MTAVQVYGVGGTVAVGPPVLSGSSAPSQTIGARLGQLYFDTSVSPAVEYTYNGNSWVTGNASGTFTNLAVSGDASVGGNLTVTGLNSDGNVSAGIIQATNEFLGPKAVLDGSGGSGVVLQVIGSSANTIQAMVIASANATTDAINVQQGGISVAPTTIAAGASPRVCNNRFGQVVFSGVSIAAAATQTLVITNSTVIQASTVILYSMTGGTTGSALSIQSVTNSAGSSSIVVANGTGATTSTGNLTFTFWVLN